jgi:hypothetical protein
MNFIKKNKIIFSIFVLGLSIRLFYAFFLGDYVAQAYFGIDGLYTEQSEIKDWIIPIKNLFEKGIYSANLNNEYGCFARMPGYPFFIAIFYSLLPDSVYLYFIGYTQILLDSLTIFFIYKIYQTIYPSSKYAWIAPLLFALSPLNIFWSATLFSETLSIFLMILAFYLYVCTNHRYTFFLIGLTLGAGILVRPQLAILTAVFLGFYLFKFISTRNNLFPKQLLLLSLGILLTYGWWPLRNYVFHDKLILTHDIRGIEVWGVDVTAYTQYNFSIQSHSEPQITQIIQNKPVDINPALAYQAPTDSSDLATALHLAKNYGSGFSKWKGYWKEAVAPNYQDTVIAALFNKLQQHQIQLNPTHYWLVLPLENLNKCFFKNDLESGNAGSWFQLRSVIFFIRTFLLFSGIIGTVLLLKHNYHPAILIIFVFFIVWYLSISFGPTSYMRNIELRYLLQCDTLMLLPAAYLYDYLLRSIHLFKSNS